MIPQIKLQKEHLADLQVIREIGAEALSSVANKIKELPVAPAHPRHLYSVIRKALGGNEEKADVLLRQLLSLHGMLRQLELKPEGVFEGLGSALRPIESGWSDTDFKKWESVASIFKSIFELPVVRLAAKALDLSYEHSHLWQRARIITDIRPIFDDEAKQIQGTVVSHKFLLRYDDLEGEHLLSFSVDENDIESLIKQCERALRKAQTAKIQLEEKAGIKTLIPGKE